MSRRKTSPPTYSITDRIVRASIVRDRLNRIERGEYVEAEQMQFTLTGNTHTDSPPAEPETH
jgi:hypothetical protein